MNIEIVKKEINKKGASWKRWKYFSPLKRGSGKKYFRGFHSIRNTEQYENSKILLDNFLFSHLP
jgi:hypothetical protein